MRALFKMSTILLFGFLIGLSAPSCFKDQSQSEIFLHEKCKNIIKSRMENINPSAKGCVLCEARWEKHCRRQCSKLLKNWENAKGNKFHATPAEIQEIIPILNNYLSVK